MSTLAVILARKGSKGIAHKNKKKLAGKPLVFYTIKAAQEAALFDHIVVSSDDPEILQIAESRGGEVLPLRRPAALATDQASSEDALRHAVEWYQKTHPHPTVTALLQPTSPFRTGKQLAAAFQQFLEAERATGLLSVVENTKPLYLYKKIDEDGFLGDICLQKKPRSMRRQDQEKSYVINGAFYFLKTSSFLATNSLYSEHMLAYVMDSISSFDIDEPLDFEIATFLHKKLAGK